MSQFVIFKFHWNFNLLVQKCILSEVDYQFPILIRSEEFFQLLKRFVRAFLALRSPKISQIRTISVQSFTK